MEAPTGVDATLIGTALLVVVVTYLGYSDVLQQLRARWELACVPRLQAGEPRLQSCKLTRSALVDAAREHRWLVRLPGERRELLLLDPKLSRTACESDALVRDVAAYKRYEGFLHGALVLLPSDGAAHPRVRAALLPLFSAVSMRRSHGELVRCVDEMLQRLERDVARSADGAVDVRKQLQLFVLEAASAAFMAHRLGPADATRLAAIFGEFEEDPPGAGGGDGDGDDSAVRRRYEALLDRVVASQEAQPGQPSVLRALREAGVADPVGEARRQSAGLLFAALNGANELFSVLRMLGRHPDLQRAAATEAAALDEAAAAGPLPGSRLPHLSAIVDEALRLEPGILHFRLRARRGTSLPLAPGRRVWIPRDTTLVVSPYLLHRHPRHWPQPPAGAEPVAQPTLFLPKHAPPAARGREAEGAEAYIPFGAGPKRCIASQFALSEARLLLAAVLRRFELRALPNLSVYARNKLELRARMAA
jgi:cytochrome P450